MAEAEVVAVEAEVGAEGGIPGMELLPDPTLDLPPVVSNPATPYSSASSQLPVPAAPDPALLPFGALAPQLQPPPQIGLLEVAIQ